MNLFSKATYVALSLLVAAPMAIAQQAQTPNKGGGDAAPVAAPSLLTSLISGNNKWYLAAVGSTTAGVAAYNFVPGVQQKVTAAKQAVQAKAQQLCAATKRQLAALDKPVSQADVIVLTVGGASAYYLGTPALAKARELTEAAVAKVKAGYTAVTENDFVKTKILASNTTKAATVVALVATVVAAHQAVKAYKAKAKKAKPAAQPVAASEVLHIA
jgi:hypothetical protein